MNILEFFHNQSPKNLTQEKKSKIYRDFLKKREGRYNTTRRSLVSKRTIIYTTISIFTLSGMFFYPLENTTNTPQQTTSKVMAQNIGNIIEFKGQFSISNNGRIIQSKNIQIKDIIKLEKGAKIKILINDSFQTEILGPAIFEIVPIFEDDRMLYNLKFANGGDFIAVDTQNNTNDTEISIETTQGVTIKNSNKEDKTNNTSFTVIGSSSRKNTTIVNKSNREMEASTSIKNNTDSKIIIAPTQIVEVGQSKDEGTNTGQNLQILESKTLEGFTEKKLLAEINSLLEEKESKIISTKDPSSSPIINEKIEEEIEENIQTVPEHIKYQIQQNLYKSFIKNDIENIFTYHLLGNKSASEISRNNLINRITRISNITGIPIQKGSDSITSIIKNIDEITMGFSSKYPNNKKTLTNLNTAKDWLQLINIYEFGGHREKQNGNSPWTLEEIIEMLKINKKTRQYKFR